MKHEGIKKAVLRANLPDADVALRVLDRIDKDDAFRDALSAVIDGDEGALQTVIYNHFSPVKHKHGNGMRSKPTLVAKQLGVTIDAQEVIELVNDHALEVLVDLLSTDAIEERMLGFIDAHMEAIVLGVIGLEKDTYRGYRPCERNGNKSSSGNAIRARIQEKMLPVLLEKLDATDLLALADEVVTRGGAEQLKSFYKQEVADLVRAAAKQRAKEQAITDVERFMRDVFGNAEDEDE